MIQEEVQPLRQKFCPDATNPVEVAYSLKGLEYPADKQGLLDCAVGNAARDEVIAVIMSLPNEKYIGPFDIAKAISNISCYRYFRS